MPSRIPDVGGFAANQVFRAAHVNAVPGGGFGWVQATADQGGIGTSTTDLTGLSVSVTVVTSRLVKVTGQVQANPSVPAYVTITIAKGGTAVGRVGKAYSEGDAFVLHGGLVLVLAAGTHVFNLRGETSTGTFVSEANSIAPAWLLVEDLGPVL